MTKKLRPKFFSCLLVLAILFATINGACENAHAMQSHYSAASIQVSACGVSASETCPCCPSEHRHSDSDGCNTCLNCICHGSLAMQQFQFGYNPVILDLKRSEPFKYLPEVYLTRFIPPQNLR